MRRSNRYHSYLPPIVTRSISIHHRQDFHPLKPATTRVWGRSGSLRLCWRNGLTKTKEQKWRYKNWMVVQDSTSIITGQPKITMTNHGYLDGLQYLFIVLCAKNKGDLAWPGSRDFGQVWPCFDYLYVFCFTCFHATQNIGTHESIGRTFYSVAEAVLWISSDSNQKLGWSYFQISGTSWTLQQTGHETICFA
jgi:hypothetical protein